MPSSRDVAEFLVEELNQTDALYQGTIARKISNRFGDEFTFINRNGNRAICKYVLSQFKALTPHAVWDKEQRMWRKRRSSDNPGRQQ